MCGKFYFTIRKSTIFHSWHMLCLQARDKNITGIFSKSICKKSFKVIFFLNFTQCRWNEIAKFAPFDVLIKPGDILFFSFIIFSFVFDFEDIFLSCMSIYLGESCHSICTRTSFRKQLLKHEKVS